MTVDEMLLVEMPLNKMTLDKMTLDKMMLDKMTLDKMTLDKMTLDKMTLDKMTWQKNKFFYSKNTFENVQLLFFFQKFYIFVHLESVLMISFQRFIRCEFKQRVAASMQI